MQYWKLQVNLVVALLAQHFVICVQEVDLLLNDGSKQINAAAWKKNTTLSTRVETSRRRSRRCLLMTLALARTAVQQVFT